MIVMVLVTFSYILLYIYLLSMFICDRHFFKNYLIKFISQSSEIINFR